MRPVDRAGRGCLKQFSRVAKWSVCRIVPRPHGRLKQTVADMVSDGVARVPVRRFRWGSFLVADMRRI